VILGAGGRQLRAGSLAATRLRPTCLERAAALCLSAAIGCVRVMLGDRAVPRGGVRRSVALSAAGRIFAVLFSLSLLMFEG